MLMTPVAPLPHGKDPHQRVLDPELFNAGPPPALLGEHQVTPEARFFTRSHAPVPAVDPAAWRLTVGGLVRRPLSLSLDDLRRSYLSQSVTATLICAGLRRDELLAVAPIPGELPWGLEPISNGIWSGVALRDVLMAAGALDSAHHVGFTGLDAVERKGRRFGFGGSIPLEKALAAEVLLAFELNCAPLSPAHGAPVRMVVPGYYGARSVKWLSEIELREEPSDNYFQADAYRVLERAVPGDPRDVRTGRALSEVVLNAVVLTPEAGAVVSAGPVEVSGWAIGAGGGPVSRVEVSADGGRSWSRATFREDGGPWAWVRWRATLPLARGRHTLVVRAFDVEGRGQPESLASVWNVKGYANNAWHRVDIEVGG